MDEAETGVIYVSFGSVLQGSQVQHWSLVTRAHNIHPWCQVPADKKAALLAALGSLEQRVLMKWESEEMEGRPDNLALRSFLPQQVESESYFTFPSKSFDPFPSPLRTLDFQLKRRLPLWQI